MQPLVVIPARMSSSRFPGKPLYKIAGREMILRVCDRLPNYEKVVATPDQEIADIVRAAGYEVFMTKRPAEFGTSRLVELSESVSADIYLNVQGDEPLISETTVQKIIDEKINHYDKIVTGIAELETNPDCVKIILNGGKWCIGRKLYQHIGIFAFNRTELQRFGEGRSWEGIDLTQYLSINYPVHFVEVDLTPGVNRPEDVEIVERLLC